MENTLNHNNSERINCLNFIV